MSRPHHHFKPRSDIAPGFNRFDTAGKAQADAAERSKDTDKYPLGVDAYYDAEYEGWYSAPMLSSRGLDSTIGEIRFLDGKSVNKHNFSKIFRDFGPKVHFRNPGIGADGIASVTINCASQDFSYRDLQEFAQQLIKLADELARIDRRQIKAEMSAPTNSKN